MLDADLLSALSHAHRRRKLRSRRRAAKEASQPDGTTADGVPGTGVLIEAPGSSNPHRSLYDSRICKGKAATCIGQLNQLSRTRHTVQPETCPVCDEKGTSNV